MLPLVSPKILAGTAGLEFTQMNHHASLLKDQDPLF
jgi:hypothetical protein